MSVESLSFTLVGLTPQDFQAIWAGLGELPSKTAFPVLEKLKAQITAQEQAHAAKLACAASPAAPQAEPLAVAQE